jgi:syndecan 2
VDPDDDKDHSDAVELKSRTFLSTIRDPLIFAGIIGGAVLALLCIVLLVMFTIYRMRKKDEGSYPLDEPRHRTTGVKYERAKQEFFA